MASPGPLAPPPQNAERARRLRELHRPGRPLVLVNVWDVLGARVVEAQGAAAVATSSWALALALGRPDGEGMSRAENLAVVQRIAEAVAVPVTADLERGYGATPDEVGDTVTALVATGAVGCNLEDSLVPLGEPAAAPLRPLTEQVQRLAAARDAATRAGVPVVLNARTDAFARDGGLAGAIERGRAYLEAGADCVLVVGVSELSDIAALATAFDGRLNVIVRPGMPSLGELAAAGVCRVSIGGSGPNLAYSAFARAAADLLSGGAYPLDLGTRLRLLDR